jgi:dihydroxyacetone kinase-like protein
MGIHGEPGTHRETIQSARATVETLLNRILTEADVKPGDEVAVLVNGLGATPLSELYIAYRSVADILKHAEISVYRAFVGEFMTSLEMAGFSLSLLKLDAELKGLLDAPACTPAWRS